MWAGDTHLVISACEILSTKSDIAAQALTYFRNNANRMQYDKFREQAYMIGSGTVESGCKQIVTQRLKHFPAPNGTLRVPGLLLKLELLGSVAIGKNCALVAINSL